MAAHVVQGTAEEGAKGPATAPTARRWVWVLPVIYCVGIWFVSVSYLYHEMFETPYWGDETQWIGCGWDYADLLLKGDFTRSAWERDPTDIFGEMNMHLGKMIIGLPIAIYGKARLKVVHGLDAAYNWKQSYTTNRLQGNIAPPALLAIARSTCVGVAGFLCVLTFLVARRIGGGVAGGISVALLLLNGTFVSAATRAMTDMPYNLFLLFGFAGALAFAAASGRKRLAYAALAGLAGGLATCVKFTGLPLIGAVLFVVAAVQVGMRLLSVRGAVANLAIAGMCGMGLVYLLTPNYWPRPEGFSARALGQEIYQLVVERKKISYADGTQEELLTTLSHARYPRRAARAAYPQFTSTVMPLLEVFLLPHRWADAYERLSVAWPGNKTTALRTLWRMFIVYRAFPGEVLILLGSLCYLGRGLYLDLRTRALGQKGVLLLYFGVLAAFLLFAMDWEADRYYVPIIVAGAIVSSVGTAALLEWGWAYASRREAQASGEID